MREVSVWGFAVATTALAVPLMFIDAPALKRRYVLFVLLVLAVLNWDALARVVQRVRGELQGR